MRYRANHKFHAHQQLVKAAAAMAKAEGFAPLPLRRLTAAAGRSTGSFYALLDSKEELLRSIVEYELERTLHFMGGEPPPDRGTTNSSTNNSHSTPHTSTAPAAPLPLAGSQTLREALSAYLHVSHAQDPAGGCVLPALAAEIARADPITRRACEHGLRRVHAHLAHRLGDASAGWALLSQAVGALLLARTMESGTSREEVLTSALNDLLRRHPEPPPRPRP